MKFFERFLRHEVDADDFIDAVNAWHKDPHGGDDVADYLGLTPEQYGIFLTKPEETEKLRIRVEKTGSFLAKVREKISNS